MKLRIRMTLVEKEEEGRRVTTRRLEEEGV